SARHGVKVMPLVVNENFNQVELHKLLIDSTARKRAIDALVALCQRDRYWGIQFDIEDVSIADKDRFTAWYQAASRALHDAGFRISIAIVPRAGDLAGPTAYNRWMFDSWRGGYELAPLASASDFVSWMTYDQHTRRTPPGPVAGLPWMTASVDYALRFIPAEKLSLGVPLYGTHWFVQADPLSPLRAGVGGASVSNAWGVHIIERAGGTVKWDDVQKASYGSAIVGRAAAGTVARNRSRAAPRPPLGNAGDQIVACQSWASVMDASADRTLARAGRSSSQSATTCIQNSAGT